MYHYILLNCFSLSKKTKHLRQQKNICKRKTKKKGKREKKQVISHKGNLIIKSTAYKKCENVICN
jgi:hypothetical protein